MSTKDRRVVVTGIGVISSIGNGDEFLTGLREGRCGARDITFFDTTGFPHARLHEVPDFAYDEKYPDYGLATQMTLVAAQEALRNSGLPLEVLREARSMVAVGSTDGDGRDVDELTAIQIEKGLADLDPLLADRHRLSRMPMAITTELGLTNVESVCIPNVCSAGNYAIGAGLDAIRSGDAEYALCGGGDAPNRKIVANMFRLGATSPDTCRPFDRDRTGVVFGEGAGMLMMETLEGALSRGAPILCEVLDYNLTCDAFHPTRPVQEIVAECLRGALRNAGVEPGEVDLVMAHGTATKANDPMETGAFIDVFGEGNIPPVSAVKSMVGHTMGAAAAHACIAAILGMQHGFLPPTVGHTNLDPECPGVDAVPDGPRAASPSTVLVNSLGFGGANAAVVLRKYVAV